MPPPPLRPAPDPVPAPEARLLALGPAAVSELVAAATGADDETLRAAAVRRLAQFVDAGQIDWTGELAGLDATPAGRAAQLAVAAQCADATHLERLVAAVDSAERLAALVVEGSPTRLRQLAAQRIEDPDEIAKLLRQVRDRDKSVYRILKAKHDLRRAEQQRQAQLQSDMLGACVALERFSRHVYDALYVPSFEHFEARWRALEGQASEPVRERARQAIDRCLSVMAAHAQERMQEAELAAQDAARRAARQAAAAEAAAAE